MEEERHKHESFGQISFSRITGSANFYGSELEQDHYIQLTVLESEIQRDLTCDRYFATNRMPIVRLRMSAGQFSELITSMNQGDGVPCTIEYGNGKKMEPLPIYEKRKKFVHRKFEDRMKSFSGTLKERQEKARSLINKDKLSKDDKKELNWLIDSVNQEINSNIPFFAKCFQETVDEVVFEAKLETENAIQHKINSLGLQALHNENKLLNKD